MVIFLSLHVPTPTISYVSSSNNLYSNPFVAFGSSLSMITGSLLDMDDELELEDICSLLELDIGDELDSI